MKNKKLFAILTLVCFMFTLMPVAAFAGNAAVADMSIFMAKENSAPVAVGEKVDFIWKIRDNQAQETDQSLANVYVWAVDANGDRTSALNLFDANGNAQTMSATDNTYGAYTVPNLNESKVSFARPGTYTVYAGTYNAAQANQTIANAVKLIGGTQVVVYGSSEDPEKTYQAGLAAGTSALLNPTNYGGNKANYSDTNDGVVAFLEATPNNVAEKVVVQFYDTVFDANGNYVKVNDLAGKTVAIETGSSNIVVNKESAVTNVLGQIEFTLAAAREGVYNIYLDVDGVEFIIEVDCGNTQAAYIETVEEPASLVALYENEVDVTFSITDINGNAVKNADDTEIMFNAADVKYLSFTEKPVSSSLTNAGLGLTNNGDGTYSLDLNGTLDAEGKYAVKAILNNGAFATAAWEVKKFQTPVQLIIGTSTDVIELGATIKGELKYVDANGVVKVAKDAELAATGYALAKYEPTQAFSITAKSDEKYVGAVITATAVSERYDLVATKEFKVADGAVAVAFVDKAADVNVNNKLEWNIVDGTGTRVSLLNVVSTDVKYVVLDKPEGAKVSVNDATNAADLMAKGIGKVALTSNKVGNVAVQVVVKATAAEASNKVADQVKYYTGTQIIAVGTEGVGDVVVMSIGSNEIVINDAKAAIDAAPIVENNRTFVPFRALAEAFGATVAYDEATQAVTAELNGVTVVMTIGSAEYTVNGEAKTADVAPFINGSRTMVPVRFAAEAFGIKVIPTYDENGATADILFNL